MTTEAHYNKVMENYDRVLLEDELFDVRKQLDSIQSKLKELPSMPDQPKDQPTKPLPVTRPQETGIPSREPVIVKPESKKGWGKFAAGLAIGAIAVGSFLAWDKLKDDGKNEKVAKTTTEQITTQIPTNTSTTPSVTNTVGNTLKAGPPAPVANTNTNFVPRTELVKKYRNIDTGSDAQGLIGSFNIDPENPQASKTRFFNELRHNPQALAFWKSCQETGAPSYDACVDNSEALNKAQIRTKNYTSMDVAKKGEIAEDVISQFKAMKYNGVIIHNGPYRTVGVNGTMFFPMNNVRNADAWMSFTATDKDGKKSTFFVRKCDQIVEKITSPNPNANPNPNPKPNPNPNPKPEKEPKPKPPKTPVVPIPDVPKPEVPKIPVPEEPKITPKVDRNTTPAGVPGHNGGTPDVAGNGPAGQTPGADGFVPGEQKPATPQAEPTPPKLPNQPESPVQPGEVVGTPTTAPAEPAKGSETPAPTTPVNGEAGPQG